MTGDGDRLNLGLGVLDLTNLTTSIASVIVNNPRVFHPAFPSLSQEFQPHLVSK